MDRFRKTLLTDRFCKGVPNRKHQADWLGAFCLAGAGDTTKSCAQRHNVPRARGVVCGFACKTAVFSRRANTLRASPRLAKFGSESSDPNFFRISIDPFSIFLRVEGFDLPKELKY